MRSQAAASRRWQLVGAGAALAVLACVTLVAHSRRLAASELVTAPRDGARIHLDAEEAAVEGKPQVIDGGVPQVQLQDEESAETAVAQEEIRADATTARQIAATEDGWMKKFASLDTEFASYEKGNPVSHPVVFYPHILNLTVMIH